MSEKMGQESLQLLTLTEAARRSGMNRQLFLRVVDRGDIPALSFGGRRRIETRTLHSYVRRQLEQARVLTPEHE